jgi:hypothetical protein
MRQRIVAGILILLTVLLLAGQDGALWRYRHHRRRCVCCVRAPRAGPPCTCVMRLAKVGGRGLIVHNGHRISVERQARRGALSHGKKEEVGKEGQEEGAGVRVEGARK